jgi:DNA-directed RNA polymerase subunit M/transcription elongation factor TFIIS
MAKKQIKECPVCGSKMISKSFDSKKECCCDSCGSEFTINGDVTFDAVEFEIEKEKKLRGTQRSPFAPFS